MTLFSRFNTNLDQGLSKAVFDHVRNYLICSFLFAIGIAEARQQSGLFFGLFVVHYSGVALIVLSGLLFLLNFFDGIRSISKHRFGVAFKVLFILLYAITSVGIIELASSFRLAM